MKTVIWGLLITFIGTAAGAACVFFLKKDLQAGVQRALTGFAAGVMVAASIWSLIVPAIDQSADKGRLAFLPAFIGFWLGILFLLLLIPLVNVVISIILMVKLAKAFGKSGGFAAGLIFLPLIFLPILGFGSAEYIGPDGAPRATPGYGQPAYGQPAYGQPQQPTYQQPQQPTYQQPQQPTYQQPTYQQPTYQQPQQPDQTGYNPPTNG